MKLFHLVAAMFCAMPALATAQAEGPAKAEDFRLTDAAGKSFALHRFADSAAVVLVTFGVDCPKVQELLPTLKLTIAEYGAKNIAFLGLDPCSADTREKVDAALKTAGLDLPVLMDEAQAVTRRLASTRYAEAIVVDPHADWKIIYRGDAAKLKEALDAQLAGQPLPAPAPSVGCAITFDLAPAQATYTDVAPILQAKCAGCHHEGGVAPFTMANAKKVQGIADTIREVLLQKRMPPWHADPHFGSFANDRALTPKEQATLLAWIDGGAQVDPAAPDPLALAQYHDDEWSLGTPDAVVQLPEPESLPAEGVVAYRYRYVPSGFTEDKWVRGLEVKAGNQRVVHHALIFVIYPKEYRHLQPNARSGLGGYFASYLPGAAIQPLPEGSAQWVPAGSTFVFQMHYTVDGKPETDQTKMALYFAKEPPAEEFRIEAAADTDFHIPPNAMDSGTTAEYRFDRNAKIWGLSPHMHYRGSRFRFDLDAPDGTFATLLNVPHYEFDWQPLYLLKEPVPVTADTFIRCDGGFDNSRFNPRNPDPKRLVRFGEQSFEEMFIGYVAYTTPRDDTKRKPLPPERIARMGCGKTLTPESIVGTKWRMGGDFTFEFQPDNRMVANGLIGATCKWGPNHIEVINPFHPLDLGVVGDELYLNGRPLRYLRGDDSDNEPSQWEGRGNRNRRPLSPEEQQRREERRKLWQQYFPGETKPDKAS